MNSRLWPDESAHRGHANASPASERQAAVQSFLENFDKRVGAEQRAACHPFIVFPASALPYNFPIPWPWRGLWGIFRVVEEIVARGACVVGEAVDASVPG